jgi:hypothetical protein
MESPSMVQELWNCIIRNCPHKYNQERATCLKSGCPMSKHLYNKTGLKEILFLYLEALACATIVIRGTIRVGRIYRTAVRGLPLVFSVFIVPTSLAACIPVTTSTGRGRLAGYWIIRARWLGAATASTAHSGDRNKGAIIQQPPIYGFQSAFPFY